MSQASTLAVGSKVGRYSLVAEAPDALAAASFVGRAEDGRLVRVFLVTRAGTDADAVQRAAAQAKNLTHPSVVRLADVDPADGRTALSFEYAEGATLQTLVAAAGSAGLSRGVALRITLDLLEGLGAGHAAGLAHGELGPHLVLVGTDGRARIAGLGVAKGLGKALAPKTPSDRLAYIAAERVKAAAAGGSPVADQKCDVFSAAVIAWELFAKQRLFAGRLESAVIQKVLTGPVAPLAASSDEIPDGVDEALKKALERDPARRTATTRELSEALEGAFAEGPASHEEVARAVEELAKKPLAELRERLAAAGATSATGELVVPPARPSLPTLDDSWVQSDDEPAKPAARAAGKPPPPPPPRIGAKPIVKLPEVKSAAGAPDAKLAAPGADVKLPVQPVDVKIEAKPAAAETKSADAKGAETKSAETKSAVAADAKAPVAAGGDVDVEIDVEPSDAKDAGTASTPDSKPAAEVKSAAEVKVATPAAPKVAPKGAAIPRAGVAGRRVPDAPRKATLLGLASPLIKVEAAPKPAATASEPETKAEAATTPAPASSGEKLVDSAAARGPEAGAPSSEPAAAKAEAFAEPSPPVSKPTPTLGTGTKPPGDPEPTPSSHDGEVPLAERKKRSLPGNLKPGDALGRYELLLPVASGGMATVWAARLQGTAGFQKTVAIKTMLPALSSDADFEEMFLDEARVAARIRHPNVVEIFDLGEEGETLYLVMEWVDGETVGALQRGAKGHGGVPMPILLRLASQVCAGLHAAHELRDDKGALVDLVHRDISPANILVSRTGFVKIVDFGVAKSKARMYTTRVGGMIKGKTPYLSPEQLAGQPIDRRSDIYSFGAVLYVLATGLHPFRGENDAKTIENIALRDPVSLRKLDPSIPAEFEAIVLKALAKDRDNRFETASEMQRAIDTLAASTGEAVNDDDVAAFVRKVAGEGLEKRTTALRDAIAAADAGKPPIQPRQVLSSESGKESAGPTSSSVAAAPASSSAAAAPASGSVAAVPSDDAMKVEIDDVDVEEPGKPASTSASAAASKGAASSVGSEAPPITAPSLGSDFAPDTLAAASTEPTDGADVPPPRRRGPLLAVGGVLGVCALIGIIALSQSGGDKPGQPASASASAAVTAPPPRTGQPAETSAPTATAPASAEPTATATPTATAEPTASATADTAQTPEPPASSATAPTTAPAKPVTVVSKPAGPAKPPTTAPKPSTKPTTTKPPKKFEPSGL